MNCAIKVLNKLVTKTSHYDMKIYVQAVRWQL